MLNRQSKENRRKENNKGFSLVELIVVIAIMAVLVAVLAPQFTKYIDQSRKSNDAATVSGIVTAAQVGIADTTNYTIDAGKYTIVLTKTSGATISKTAVDGSGTATSITASDTTNNLADAIVDTCESLANLKITSNKWTDNKVEIYITYDGETVTVDYSSDFKDYIQ